VSWADDVRVPIAPKSIHSLYADLRASGKTSARTILPVRMSTLSKSAKAITPSGSVMRRNHTCVRRWMGLAAHSSGQARVGCSGWEYKHWRGDFYPAEVPRARWFPYYAAAFDTVEINNTFYRLPEAGTFERWASQAPKGFVYAVKASRFLTHMKKLKDPEQPLELLFERMAPLRKRLGPVLYQLPPGWKLNRERLEHFLQVLPRGVHHVLEFRDPTWYADDIYAMLERFQVSLCLHDMQGSASGRQRVGPIIYVRFHGAGEAKYGGAYPHRRLRDWAEWLNVHRAAGTDAYAYFNNDIGGHAPRDAATLRRLLAE
jgi:uncharacterized protein YecE (DUF72 family)